MTGCVFTGNKWTVLPAPDVVIERMEHFFELDAKTAKASRDHDDEPPELIELAPPPAEEVEPEDQLPQEELTQVPPDVVPNVLPDIPNENADEMVTADTDTERGPTVPASEPVVEARGTIYVGGERRSSRLNHCATVLNMSVAKARSK